MSLRKIWTFQRGRKLFCRVFGCVERDTAWFGWWGATHSTWNLGPTDRPPLKLNRRFWTDNRS